jgi:hypothetical protein
MSNMVSGSRPTFSLSSIRQVEGNNDRENIHPMSFYATHRGHSGQPTYGRVNIADVPSQAEFYRNLFQKPEYEGQFHPSFRML